MTRKVVTRKERKTALSEPVKQENQPKPNVTEPVVIPTTFAVPKAEKQENEEITEKPAVTGKAKPKRSVNDVRKELKGIMDAPEDKVSK